MRIEFEGSPHSSDEEHNQPPDTQPGCSWPPLHSGMSPPSPVTSSCISPGLCPRHCQWLHHALALRPHLVQDRPVHHLRHRLRLHLHPRPHGRGQVEHHWKIIKRETLKIFLGFFRFLAVVFPVTSLGYRTIPNAKIAICLTWITPTVLAIPVWHAHNTLTIDTRELHWDMIHRQRQDQLFQILTVASTRNNTASVDFTSVSFSVRLHFQPYSFSSSTLSCLQVSGDVPHSEIPSKIYCVVLFRFTYNDIPVWNPGIRFSVI